MKIRSMWNQIKHEPYRLFFPLGILIGIVGVGHWPLYTFGASPNYSQFFHSSLQSQVYLLCFVVGFLLTAMPKFAAAEHASSGEVLRFLFLILANTVALGFGQWAAAQGCFIGALLALLLFAKKRLLSKTSKVTPPLEFVWVPIALLHGLVGSILMILVECNQIPSRWLQPAKLMSEQGFILCIVIGVGGFLAPRLMGTFRVLNKPGQLPDHPDVVKFRRRIVTGHLLAGAAFFLSFFFGLEHLQLSYGLRAVIITAEFLWTCSYLRLPRSPDFYAKLVWLSLWMVVAGSWAVFLWPAYRTAMLHIVFIGGFSLMIFAVATMVVLSHGGEPEKLRRPLPVLWITGVGIVSSLVFRIAAVFFTESYFLLLGIAGMLWILAGICWFIYILPKTVRGMSAEELEACHEDSKQRVNKLRGG